MKVLLLAREQENTKALFHVLSSHFDVCAVLLERPQSEFKKWKYRIRRLGLLTAIGQLLFLILIRGLTICRLLPQKFKLRLHILKSWQGFALNEIPERLVERIENVNDPRVLEVVKSIKPDVIVVNGTSLIKKELIQNSPLMINIHTGITPQYRGVHGGYWACANGDFDHCGVTLHQIDVGVDTGRVFVQKKVEVTDADWFMTYPLLQYQKILPELVVLLQLIKKVKSHPVSDQKINSIGSENHSKTDLSQLLNQLSVVDCSGRPSKQYFHPTIWQYLKTGLQKNIW